jgi:hypothetical protein
VRHTELFGEDFARRMIVNKFSSPAEKKTVEEAFDLIMKKSESDMGVTQ